ncbi:MAG: DUF2189 domain-containing protein [Tepidimonas ignava]|uniref:Putative membrane protein n=1 Tax=Tepidimonas ignava TaxID=114249 RepID=A0A4R3LI73_9BURK|nr:DUF2189 domain-containing protein [Tepidimonas ignava]MCX7814425.1 DUF2189 domain-containing protein [Tepidimonas ignava]TCS99390.1 putative membrane protein [Tepidimonas ignava]TSE24217.1 hypothetical protein Tigna_00220 [Tepidimonas ignava]
MPHDAHTAMPGPEVTIDLWSPLRWLQRGARDYAANPLPGVLHGSLMALFGIIVLVALRDRFWLLAGAFSGFLIIAPVLASGLYAVSWYLERGQKVCCQEVMALWASGDRRLITFGLLLALAGTGWVLTSAALITLWAPVPIERPLDFVRHVVLAPDIGLFEVWLLLGAWLAAPVFASSVMALPMMVDTHTPLWRAVGESWRAVGAQPVVMGLWAVVIAVLVGLGMALAMVGLIVVVPLLAYASWHAYRDFERAGLITPVRAPRA